MKIHVELLFPSKERSRSLETTASSFESYAHELLDPFSGSLDIKGLKMESGLACAIYELTSPRAFDEAIKLGESIRNLSRCPPNINGEYCFLRTAAVRVWIRKSCPTKLDHARKVPGRAEHRDAPTTLVQQSLHMVASGAEKESSDSSESERSVFVESFMVDLSIERQGPIFLAKSRPELGLIRVPPFRVFGPQCINCGSQTDDAKRVTPTTESLTEGRHGIIGMYHVSSDMATHCLVEQGPSSPISIRPIRKQGKDLWDND